MTIEELVELNIDQMNKLTKNELKIITKRMVDAANKRLKRLGSDTLGRTSIAYEKAMKHGGFSVKGRNTDIKKLRNLYKELRLFFKMKSSSVGGYKKLRQKIYDQLGIDRRKIDEVAFWKAYRKFTEEKQAPGRGYGSTQIQLDLKEIYEGKYNDMLHRITSENIDKFLPNDTNADERERIIMEYTKNNAYVDSVGNIKTFVPGDIDSEVALLLANFDVINK